jgi:hypothetical protein
MTSTRSTRRYKHPEQRWEALRARIEAHASLLVDQGDPVLKTIGAKRYWYLRFLLPADGRGHRRHRSLYVGREHDQELVARVRALLESYREPSRLIREIAGYLRVVRILGQGVQAAARGGSVTFSPTRE